MRRPPGRARSRAARRQLYEDEPCARPEVEDAGWRWELGVRAVLQLVALACERDESCLKKVVGACCRERPGEKTAEPRREDLRGREAGGGPGADAAAARDELPDRLVEV